MSIRLIQGDCLDEMDKLIENNQKVNLILTDPPYNIGKDKGWDNRRHEEYIEFMGTIFKASVSTVMIYCAILGGG